jgi:hypothetical protein
MYHYVGAGILVGYVRAQMALSLHSRRGDKIF